MKEPDEARTTQDPNRLGQLAKSDNASTRLMVAKNPATPDTAILHLARDSGFDVREAARKQAEARSLDTPTPGSYKTVDATRVTTLAELPGFRVVAVLGVVSELAAVSGLTAGWKGKNALADATHGLGRAAAAMGANGILGLGATVFGAGGGITSAFGGDAVGVLLMGTAVVLEPDQPSGEPPRG